MRDQPLRVILHDFFGYGTSVSLPLSASVQTLQVYAAAGNWNLNWIEFSTAPLPNLDGKVVYHAYSDYNNWDSELYVLDLDTGALNCLSCSWNIDHAMNAQFNYDGTELTFMGDVAGDSVRDWDVFLYDFNQPSQAPVNLTAGRGTRDEDPKFSPDGDKFVYKEGHWDAGLNQMVFDLKEMNNLTGQIINTVTNNTDEESMPSYSADGSRIYYARGAGAGSDIYPVKVNGTNNRAEQNLANVQEYFPIVRSSSSYFYTRWVSASVHNDQIYLKTTSGNVSMPFNDNNNNYSDVFPLGSQYVLFSSTRPAGKGGYDLYVGTSGRGTSGHWTGSTRGSIRPHMSWVRRILIDQKNNGSYRMAIPVPPFCVFG